jgi:hypothetical protein
MAISIVEIHASADRKQLNTEWFVLTNDGDKPFSTKNCTLHVGRKGSKKRKQLGVMDPGITLAPGEKVRVVTGNPGKKAHGKMPEGELQNYSLFLGAPVLMGSGTELLVSLRSMPLARAVFDANAKFGIASDE